MKCKRCGAELKRKGEFCNNCINEMKDNEENINDTEIQLVLKRKFSFWYQLSEYIEPILILMFMFIVSYITNILSIFGYFFVFFTLIGALSFIVKAIRVKTDTITFYKTRLVYQHNFLGKRSKIVKYKNIVSIEYTANPTILQRLFNIIDIEIKAERSKLLLNTLSLKTIEKNDELLLKIAQITNVKEK